MNSRYIGYHLPIKLTAFIPSGLAMAVFVFIIISHGRFPDNQVHFYVLFYFLDCFIYCGKLSYAHMILLL